MYLPTRSQTYFSLDSLCLDTIRFEFENPIVSISLPKIKIKQSTITNKPPNHQPPSSPQQTNSTQLKIKSIKPYQPKTENYWTIETKNEKNQIMKSNVWLRLVWYDYQLQWDEADYGGIGVLRLPPDKVWKPDIVLFNKWVKGFTSLLLLLLPNSTNCNCKLHSLCLYLSL